jgi:uncharacterized protein YqjF (DUF2071 family)
VAGRHPPHSVRFPVMHQTWTTFAALHWRYDAATVQRHLPPGLTVDTFEGGAWVSLTPFCMTDVRFPGLPPAPGVSTFPEANLRTYVLDPEGRDGLWFLTLEAASLPFVAFARAALRVPYSWADMAVERIDGSVDYRSNRRLPRAEVRSRVVLTPGDPRPTATLTPLDDFLMGRWRGYAPTLLGLGFLPIEHEPWPLQEARLEELDETVLGACGLPPPEGEAIVHYSPGVHARFGPPVLVRRGGAGSSTPAAVPGRERPDPGGDRAGHGATDPGQSADPGVPRPT